MSKKTYVVKRKYPFLENFPFSEFTFEPGETLAVAVDEDGEVTVSEVEPVMMKFVYEKDGSSITVFVFDQELQWMNDISKNVKDLNEAAKIIDIAIESNDLLVKRDGSVYADVWCNQLRDHKFKLSYSTSGEILMNLVKSPEELVSIINKIRKLNSKSGIVGLSANECRIALTYYQFQLIYAKLLLGIIIAAKISL